MDLTAELNALCNSSARSFDAEVESVAADTLNEINPIADPRDKAFSIVNPTADRTRLSSVPSADATSVSNKSIGKESNAVNTTADKVSPVASTIVDTASVTATDPLAAAASAKEWAYIAVIEMLNTAKRLLLQLQV